MVDAYLLTCALRDAGIRLSLDGAGNLAVFAPDGAMPAETVATITANKDNLAARLQYEQDPRADLASDHALWVRLLGMAQKIDGDDPDGLYYVLHGLRCEGAQLVEQGGRVRLVAGGMDGDDYTACRERYLRPHDLDLRQLLCHLTLPVRSRALEGEADFASVLEEVPM